MGWIRFFRRSRWDDERACELQDYLAHEIDDNLARGMSPSEAAKAAHRRLGNATRIREEIYEMNTLAFVDTIWQDLRHGFRLLRRNPTFSIVAILTLALGTGANAAIFQIVNSVRMRPLPVEGSHELASIGVDTKGAGRSGRFLARRAYFTEPLWQAIRAKQQGFSHLFAWGVARWNVGTGGEYRPVRGLYVSGSFFKALDVNAQAGRVLTETDDQPGCGAPGAVLSHGFWQLRYGGNPEVIGQTISVEGRPLEIIGVTPPEFFGVEVGRNFDLALPLCSEALLRGAQSGIGQPDVWFLDLMGRLKPGWTIERAQAQIDAVSPAILQATLPPRYDADTARGYLNYRLTVAPAGTGVSGVRRAYETQLWVLLGATALVLLITCGNLANLMLARATAREREIAVRLAIGASRRRIVRQMLSESLLIAGFGAIGGALLAQWLSRSLVLFLSTDNNQLFLDLTPDWRVFAFITGLAVSACLLFGLSPAIKATATNPGHAMQAGTRSSTDGPERFALRRGLVILQVALSMVLIVGALLFGRSFRNLVGTDLGFRQDGVIAVGIDMRRMNIAPESSGAIKAEAVSAVRAVAGVLSASEARIVPMSGSGWNDTILIEGQEQEGNPYFNRVGTEYFQVMETPVLAGRAFGPEDRRGGVPTAIVNESFARKYFKGRNPIGRAFQIAEEKGEERPHYQIVGLVKDTKYTDLREEFAPIAYFPAAQEVAPSAGVDVVIRTDLPLASITPSITRAVLDIAPGATVSFDSLRTFVRDSLVTERLMAILSGFFGVLAMVIATLGLYGVLSYMVSRRRVEIGIRMALGANPRSVVVMVLRESGRLLMVGVAAGIGLAALLSGWAASLLYDLEPYDSLSFVLAGASLALVSLLASWIPARRASRLPLSAALRAD